MDFQVKICGVRDHDGAQACVDAGAGLVGFNFVPSSKRFVTPSKARVLVRAVGAERAVGVFRNQDPGHVLEVSRAVGVRWIQLHGDESPELCETLRREQFRVIKAIAITADTTPGWIAAYEPVTDMRLFDAASPGSGQLFEHERLLALSPVRPFLLAGGLSSENVREAVERVRPDGVDTASGVEWEGRMDPSRVAAFCHEARRARVR